MKNNKKIKGQRILIFGGTGSLGKTLVRRYVEDNIVCVYSRDESKHWTLKNEFPHKNLKYFIGDIRDKNRCLEAILFFRPTHIILASALKHVDICENAPFESFLTNVQGIANVVKCVSENLEKFSYLKTVLMVSTDKACSPINVYGMCKATAERLVTTVSNLNCSIKFIAVRYGNVLESRGSIIPLFKYQAENKEAITVTNKDMTRYVMTLDESVDLIEAAILKGKSGETWVHSLPSMKIIDLAEIFSELHSKRIETIGMRPGEKIHEDLINESEATRTRKAKKYFVISPSYVAPFTSCDFKMNSSTSLMSKEELKNHLSDLGILSASLSEFVGKNIEDIRIDSGDEVV